MDAEIESVEAGQDLRGALEAAFKEQKEAPVIDKHADVRVEVTGEEIKAAQRARDEQGRFAKAEEKEADKSSRPQSSADRPVIGSSPGSTPEAIAAAEAAKGENKTSRIPAPPNSWSDAAKAEWHKLPSEVLAAISAREQDFGKTAGKMDEERAVGRDIQKVFQPYMALLAAEGTTPIQATAALLNTAYILRQGSPDQKRTALLEVARQHGIDIAAPANGQQTQVTPELAALRQEVAQLRSQFSQRDLQSQASNEAEIARTIDAFAADPANSHYEEVKADMAALLSGGRAKDLQTAYDMACWARPDVRSSILAQQRAEEETKRREQEIQRVNEARRKGISITGAPGSTAGAKAGSERSLRDELEANMAAARSAV